MLDALWRQEVEGSANEGAAHTLKHVKHPNAALVAPLWQGEACVGLSGLYAVLNGIRLAVAHQHRLSAGEVDALMRAGLRFLDGRLSPQQCVLNGLRVQLWRSLAQAMVEAAWRHIGLRLTAERVWPERHASRGAAFAAIEEALYRWRVPLVLCRGGHYTAVRGTTTTSLLLLDSCGACWINKRVCGIPGDGEAMRHATYPNSLIGLTV